MHWFEAYSQFWYKAANLLGSIRHIEFIDQVNKYISQEGFWSLLVKTKKSDFIKLFTDMSQGMKFILVIFESSMN